MEPSEDRKSPKSLVRLTKAALAAAVAEGAGIPRNAAAEVVELILDCIVRALRRGDKVEIRGFGSFRTRQHRARIGRNPKTGIPVNVPAKTISYFTPSKELKSRMEGI
jgi:integration host factor subunit beta